MPQKRNNFKFAFITDDSVSYISGAVSRNDFAAITPMLNEYCECISTDNGVIIPIPII